MMKRVAETVGACGRGLALLCGLLLAGGAGADTAVVGGLTWSYDIVQAVEGGDPEAHVKSVSPDPEGALVVPERLGDKTVTTVKGSAFKRCTKLTAVTLPSSVTNVGESAFSGCRALERVRILATSVKFGTKPFAGCPAVTSVEMPFGSAFSTLFPDSLASLKEAVVLKGTSSLVRSALADCTNLVSVTIPSTVTSVGASAFRRCKSLKTLTLPSSVVTVGSSMCQDCKALEQVRILSLNVKFGDKPFAGCTAVASVEIPSNAAFSRLFPDSLASLREVVVLKGTSSLVASAFAGCFNLVSVTLPSTLENIKSASFQDCTALESIVIPASVREFGSKVFMGCTKLASVTFLCEGMQLKPNTFDDTPENLVVRIPSSVKGWVEDEDGNIAGRTAWFYMDGNISYPVPVVESSNFVSGIDARAAQIVWGCVMDEGGEIAGVVQVKIGKAGRKGSRISAKWTNLEGKSSNLRSISADLSSGAQVLRIPLAGTQKGVLRIMLGADAAGKPLFSGWMGSSHVVTSARVGGEIVRMAAFRFPGGHPVAMPRYDVDPSFLPVDEPVQMAGRKWICAQAASVDYRKDRKTGEYAYVVNRGADAPQKSNLSKLKLKYSHAKGLFGGSYTIYGLKDGPSHKTLGKTPAKVSGVVVDDVGYGFATVKGMDSWRVRVE